jgi:GNAT superfamily N-acetyltransferase
MYKIRPMEKIDLEAIRRFTDHEIGMGYYPIEELQDIYRRSVKDGVMCSLLLQDSHGEIAGIRFSYPPGLWEHGKGRGLEPAKWPYNLENTAYFQSLFLAAKLRGGGWGGKLSLEALKRLRDVGAKGVVCHSWKESPNNSSVKYLLKLGFVIVADHPLYWKDIDYNCTRCLTPPCQCTAQEMYLDLERNYEHLVLA